MGLACTGHHSLKEPCANHLFLMKSPSKCPGCDICRLNIFTERVVQLSLCGFVPLEICSSFDDL